MSRFFSSRHKNLQPYVPGEQPKDMKYTKLNTNESPFPPSQGVVKAVSEEAAGLRIYSDPECSILTEKIAEVYGVRKEQVIVSNGSDEVLNFAFMAFADEKNPLIFADITYGFYPVFAELNHIPYEEISLKDDFSIDSKAYSNAGKTVVIANPNAHTGLALSLDGIEEIVSTNPNNTVIIDEAYVDFGTQSALPLVAEYDNLLVVRTFSKSYSLAGARLGFAVGSKELIHDLNTIKYSVNPYNVNRMTCAAGYAALCERDYYADNCEKIVANRQYTIDALRKMGFSVLESKANFVLAKSDRISGQDLYTKLKEQGVLVRHFSKKRIEEYNRITIGSKAEMDILLENIRKILEETDEQSL